MIDWKRHSYVAIKKKWRNFILMRTVKAESPKAAKSHLTCLERESLIDHLIKLLDDEMTNNFKKSIGKKV